MNEQTDKLIRDLAEKLGTTAEHLWGVLIRQAPISAFTQCVTLLLLIAGVALCVKMLLATAKKIKEADYDAETWMGIAIAACIVLSIALTVVALEIIAHADIIMAGFFNPEYWAFKQIHP